MDWRHTYFAIVADTAHGPIPRPQHTVVRNATGNVLSVVDSGIDNLVTNMQAFPAFICSSGSMLVVDFDGGYSVKSTDQGATWQTYSALMPSGAYTATDGELLASSDAGSWQVSSDGGATWRKLPPLPPTNGAFYNVQGWFHTSDGSLIAAGPLHIWLLAPGATTWTDAAKLITDQYGIPTQALAISTDTSGRPLLAWSEASNQVVNGIAQPGIAYHGLK